MRIGQSTDIHQLIEGRPLILGGVEINSKRGCLGHSDADVLVHVIAESILGALALGDLGKCFPDTDPQYKDIRSLILLKEVIRLMKQEGFEIVNLDSLILIESPKIAPYLKNMKENLCPILEIDEKQINIKATRGEKIGFIGRQEGVMAQCVVLLKERV